MSHVEWNGYLIKRGVDAKSCGFILPKDRKDFYKGKKALEKKAENQQKKEPLKPKPLIEQVRLLLAKLTEGFTPSEKTYFIYDKLKVPTFSQLETKSDAELKEAIKILKAVE